MSFITKLRSYRIGPFAIFDFTMSYAGAWFAAPYLKVSREKALWLVLPIGVVLHKVIGKETPLNRLVIGPESSIIAKGVILAMAYKGITSSKET